MKRKIQKKFEQDWGKVCWKEVENEYFENKAPKMLIC